ncbi:MAG: 2TM domain-containing protein [Thermoplasmatota archaeon]
MALSDGEITRLAKQRVGFKVHAMVYVLVNLFLAGLWLLKSDTHVPTFRDSSGSYYWPVWTHLGWGLGLAIHGFMAVGPGQNLQAREEQRIREQQRR